MSFMVWNAYLETDIASIDAQHRGLVERLNRAAPLLTREDGAAREAAGALLDDLMDYVDSHFQAEEILMDWVGMDPRARRHHHAAHAGFAGEVREMVRAYRAGKGVDGERLLSFLSSWLILHILGEDQAMARQMRALDDGLSPAEAFARSGGDDLAPRPEALSFALVDLYTTLTRKNRDLSLSNQSLDASRAEVQAQNARLEEQVLARTADLRALAGELRAARDDAEAASAAKTRFLGTMSHELRTPLNAILGYARLLDDQGLTQGQAPLARGIIGAAERLLELFGSLIDYARLEAGEGGAAAGADFDLAATLAEACAAAFAAARAKGVETVLSVDPALPGWARGDAGGLRRIVAELAGNAAKFTRAGAIEVVARAVPGRDGPGLRVEVRDTGIGLSAAARARLFAPFAQADDGLARQFEGVGLGLALSRALARRLGGEVGADPDSGPGSLFWLALPLAPGAASDRPAAADIAPSGREAAPALTGPLPPALLRALARIENLLAVCDTGAAAALERASQDLRPYLGEEFHTLAERVARFDYDRALDLLKDLRARASREHAS